ncbi:MAG: M20 family metallopeptidase [Nocardioidaceae bacterium]
MSEAQSWRATLVAEMEARLPAMLADLERLVEHESPSHDLDAVAASAGLVSELGEGYLGEKAETIVIDGRTHLRWRFGGDGPRVLLLGHHDTVWPTGSLATHPWKVDDGPDGAVVRGPGCFDMLAGLVQMFHALAALTDRRAITVLVTGDEELGSPSSQELIESEARAAVAALVLEASADGGALKTQRKGVSLYDVRAVGRAAHAGLEPERGVNAGVELATQLLRIAELGDAERGTTVTPTVLSAGTTTNTVPAAGRLAVDVRATSVGEQERVDQEMRALSTTVPGSQISVEGGLNRPPLEQEQSQALFDLAQRQCHELGLAAPESASVGGGSDGNFTAGVGTATLDGLGAVGGGAHADDEHVLAREIPRRSALLAAMVDELRSAPPAGSSHHPAQGAS